MPTPSAPAYIELDRASMLSNLAPGQPWTVPVTSFLVDHPRGRLLFDTGVHGQAAARSGRSASASSPRSARRILWNPAVMRDSLTLLRKLRDQAGTTMFYGHDPAPWASMPRVPAPVV